MRERDEFIFCTIDRYNILYLLVSFWRLPMSALQMFLKIFRIFKLAATAINWAVLSDLGHIVHKLVHHISQPLNFL